MLKPKVLTAQHDNAVPEPEEQSDQALAALTSPPVPSHNSIAQHWRDVSSEAIRPPSVQIQLAREMNAALQELKRLVFTNPLGCLLVIAKLRSVADGQDRDPIRSALSYDDETLEMADDTGLCDQLRRKIFLNTATALHLLSRLPKEGHLSSRDRDANSPVERMKGKIVCLLNECLLRSNRVLAVHQELVNALENPRSLLNSPYFSLVCQYAGGQAPYFKRNPSLSFFGYDPRRVVADLSLLKEIKTLWKEPRDILIVSNSRFAASRAKRFLGRGFSLETLTSEAEDGLLAAVDKYDPERGFNFTTYAGHWIHQRLTRLMDESSTPIYLPAGKRDLLFKAREVRKEYFQRTGRKLSREDLASILDVPLEDLMLVLRASKRQSSLDRPRDGDDDSLSPFHTILASNATTPEDIAAKHELIRIHRECVEGLSQRLKKIYQLRLGLLPEPEQHEIITQFDLPCYRPLTLEQTGQYFQVTRERIRQLERKAVAQVISALEERALFSEQAYHQLSGEISISDFVNDTGGTPKKHSKRSPKAS